MLYPVQKIFDLVFPPTEHELLLRGVTPIRFNSWYRPNARADITYLTEYKLPEVQAAIAACKFEHSYHAAKLLSSLVHTHLCMLIPKHTLVIPIPLSVKRQRERQFNQVERVLKLVDTLPYSYTVCTSLLTRVRHTQPQTSLARADRLQNLNGAFAVKPHNLFYLEGIERIILCDDVLTTGTTLTAAKSALQEHVPSTIEIICLAWAH